MVTALQSTEFENVKKDSVEIRKLNEQIKQLEDRLRENEKIFVEAQEMAQLGYWKWNIETGEVEWTNGVYNIFHLDPETFTPQIDSIMKMSPWEDTKNQHIKLIELLTNNTGQTSFEQRFLRSDGSLGYYFSTCFGEYNKKGKLTHIKGIVQDILDRKKAESAIRERDEKYKNLFETMVQGVIYQDIQGQILSANPSAVRILGLSIDQMKGRKSTDSRWKSIHEDGTDFISDSHPSIVALRTGKPVRDKVMGVYNSKKDVYTWININAHPQFMPGEDKPYQVYTTFEDITVRKQAIYSLKLAQFSIDKASDAIFWIDRAGQFSYVNDEACFSLGYEREELLKLYLWDIDPIYPAEKWNENWKQYQRTDIAVQQLESIHRRKDGSTFPTEIVSKHHWFGSSEFHVVFVRNITERKLTTDKLRKSEEKFRIIFEQAAVGVAQIKTLTGQFVRMNKKYCDIIGYSEKEILKMNFEEITHSDDLQDDLDNMEKLKDGKIKEYSIEKRYIRKDGSVVWVTLTVSAMWEKGESPNYHIAIIKDITRRKKANEAILKSERLLKETVASKDKLFSIISHDLRSPFQSILGFSEILLNNYNDITDEERLKFTDEIYNSSQNAYVLLDNLLKWAMDQQGRIVINKTTLNLDHLIRESVNPYLSAANKKDIELVYVFPKDIKLIADENTMRTVIGNLVSNAIKFSKPGAQIILNAKRDKHSVILSVSDSGIGMNKKKIDSILDTDEIQSTLGTGNEIGTGLGLQLCKEFIKKNNGVLKIESQNGKGTTFSISIFD